MNSVFLLLLLWRDSEHRVTPVRGNDRVRCSPKLNAHLSFYDLQIPRRRRNFLRLIRAARSIGDHIITSAVKGIQSSSAARRCTCRNTWAGRRFPTCSASPVVCVPDESIRFVRVCCAFWPQGVRAGGARKEVKAMYILRPNWPYRQIGTAAMAVMTLSVDIGLHDRIRNGRKGGTS